jgi:hypothetical protein
MKIEHKYADVISELNLESVCGWDCGNKLTITSKTEFKKEITKVVNYYKNAMSKIIHSHFCKDYAEDAIRHLIVKYHK